MKLLEAIIEANHRALKGDPSAGVRPTEHVDALPLAALTCIDPRLNPLVPEVFGVPEEKFIWLRNAGNIITGPLSSTMRSLALACAVKGAREIAIVGHTDCLVARTSTLELTDRFQKLGVPRRNLPENLNDFFGLFASERQNVLKAVEFVRHSPLVGPATPVHGLMIDLQTGRIEWLANGYEHCASPVAAAAAPPESGAPTLAAGWQPIGHFEEFSSTPFAPSQEPIGAVPGKVAASEVAPGPAEREQPQSLMDAAQPLLDKAKQWISEVRTPDGAKGWQGTATQAARASVATVRELVEFIDRGRKYRVIGSDLKEYGPIAGFKLVQWLMEERITPESPVKLESEAEWRPLKSLIGGTMKRHLHLPPPLADIATRMTDSLRRNR